MGKIQNTTSLPFKRQEKKQQLVENQNKNQTAIKKIYQRKRTTPSHTHEDITFRIVRFFMELSRNKINAQWLIIISCG